LRNKIVGYGQTVHNRVASASPPVGGSASAMPSRLLILNRSGTINGGRRKQLAGIISKGVHPARHITRARVLLLLNEKTDREGKPVKVPEQTEVARQCGCHTMLVYRVRICL
jgi:hypothetical protein